MPKALLMYMGYFIYFWSGDNGEPVHVHASRDKQQENATKFWVTADGVELAKDTGSVEAKDMGKVLRHLRKNRERILAAWISHFGSAELKR